VYYKHPGFEVPSDIAILPGLDVRADRNGLVVAPPSVHENGRCYEWLVSPGVGPIGGVPEKILQLACQRQEFLRSPDKGQCRTIAAGERHTTVFWLACAFAKNTFTIQHLFRRVRGLNLKWVRPELPEREIQRICQNAWKYKLKSSTSSRQHQAHSRSYINTGYTPSL
jgi:hypothetical protein